MRRASLAVAAALVLWLLLPPAPAQAHLDFGEGHAISCPAVNPEGPDYQHCGQESMGTIGAAVFTIQRWDGKTVLWGTEAGALSTEDEIQLCYRRGDDTIWSLHDAVSPGAGVASSFPPNYGQSPNQDPIEFWYVEWDVGSPDATCSDGYDGGGEEEDGDADPPTHDFYGYENLKGVAQAIGSCAAIRPSVLMGLAYAESSYNANRDADTENGATALGPFQFITTTWATWGRDRGRWEGTTTAFDGANRLQVGDSMQAAAEYLTYLVNQHGGDINAALLAYNGASSPNGYDLTVLSEADRVRADVDPEECGGDSFGTTGDGGATDGEEDQGEECVPRGWGLLNPMAYVRATTCIFRWAFVPKEDVSLDDYTEPFEEKFPYTAASDVYDTTTGLYELIGAGVAHPYPCQAPRVGGTTFDGVTAQDALPYYSLPTPSECEGEAFAQGNGPGGTYTQTDKDVGDWFGWRDVARKLEGLMAYIGGIWFAIRMFRGQQDLDPSE